MQFDQAVDLLIVFVGTFLHLNQLSPFNANDPHAAVLVPNAASSLLTVVLLKALTKWRPIRGPPRRMRFSQFMLRVLVELSVIVFSVELLLIWMWVPFLEVLSGVYDWATEEFLETTLANRMNDGFFILRFLLALSIVCIIAYGQGWLWNRETNNNNDNDNTDDQEINTELRGNRRKRRNGQVHDRPITVRHAERTNRNVNGRFVINAVTLNESSA